ncbi:MAG TPA: S1 RNA-binding domain-containing protein, partial [Gemmatales bacterium]|nr:S1 RNA-binding domain-containing protein [Gemmatales bacterium]
GLVHISQLANKFIKSPYDIVSVGDIVTVWVMTVDMERKRVSLTMIPPGTERRQQERRPHGQQDSGHEGGRPPFRREGRGDRPPHGDRRPQGPRAEGQPPREGGERRFDQRGGQGGQGRPPGRFGGGQGGGRFGGGGQRRPFPPRQNEGGHQEASTPPPPPRPPVKRKEKPKPKLTEAALAGKAPLRTFGELKALFETKQTDEQPPAAVPAVPPAEASTTPPEAQ